MTVPAPEGAIVRIAYDGDPLEVGDVLKTDRGRAYAVVAVRVQAKGKHAGRQHLRCLVLGRHVPDGARVHSLRFYKR